MREYPVSLIENEFKKLPQKYLDEKKYFFHSTFIL